MQLPQVWKIPMLQEMLLENNITGGLIGRVFAYYTANGKGIPTVDAKDVYATGDVNGTDYTGGLFGGTYHSTNSDQRNFRLNIENTYATGKVVGGK